MIVSFKLFESIKPKIGDLVVCVGNINDLETNNHVGILRTNGIEFINRFSNKLHNLNGEISIKNGWYINNTSLIEPFDDNGKLDRLPIFYSRGFKELIENNINLNFLLDYERIFYSDISFIDFTLKNNTISCLSKRAYDKLENKDDVWTTTMRQNMNIGRFIKKIVPFDVDRLIEDYVNEYKFCYNLSKEDLGFKIYKGINMAKWYLSFNYSTGGGTLHSSCMKHMKSQRRLPIYIDNPDKVKMLVVVNPENKLLGRALLWKLDDPYGQVYMDRIYTAEDYIDKLFINYAKKRGYITFKDKDKILMRVNVKRDFGPPSQNPYMDTFKYFIKNGNYLTNIFKNFKAGEYYEYVDHD